MLKKNRDIENENEFKASDITDQKKFSMEAGAETKAEKTVIGEHIHIEGNIRGDEHLYLEGSVKGNIEMGKHNFVVGAKGRFDGEISSQNVGISGQLMGNVNVREKVRITKEADFSGDIKAKSISIEDGAYFKGSIELQRAPHRKTMPTAKSSDAEVIELEKPSSAQTDSADTGNRESNYYTHPERKS
jgi:cytoskeletal protein CcmA (bactofilin family)